MSERYSREYKDTRCLSYLENERHGGGECINGHWNIIPEAMAVEVTKLYCLKCGTLIFKVIEVYVIEEEVIDEP